MCAAEAISRARMSSTRSVLSISSVGSDILATVTTANCELAVLPLDLLLELQPRYLSLDNGSLTSTNREGGFNVFCDGTVLIDGRQCKVINYIDRKVTLKSHMDYKDYRETLFAKPMLFITNIRKVSSASGSERTFAFIVNTRHPQVKARLESGLNDVISSVMGENYILQFNFQKTVKEYLGRQNFELTEDNLSISFTFKLDVLLDIFFLLGVSKKHCEVDGKVLNFFCTTNEKKEKVKLFLLKMTNPLIRMGSSFERDRRPSIFSLDVISEDPFSAEERNREEVNKDTEPVLPQNV